MHFRLCKLPADLSPLSAANALVHPRRCENAVHYSGIPESSDTVPANCGRGTKCDLHDYVVLNLATICYLGCKIALTFLPPLAAVRHEASTA